MQTDGQTGASLNISVNQTIKLASGEKSILQLCANLWWVIKNLQLIGELSATLRLTSYFCRAVSLTIKSSES